MRPPLSVVSKTASHAPRGRSNLAVISRPTSRGRRRVRRPSLLTRRRVAARRPQCCPDYHADRSSYRRSAAPVDRGPAAGGHRRRRRRGAVAAGRGRRERAGVRAHAAEEPLHRVPAGVRGAGAPRPQRHRGQRVPVGRQRLHRRGRVAAGIPRYVYA